ncbi:DUF6311 domain-containing protein [Citrobacter enshiensis]|uniref:DUF6311 domain-containing protein n=1 Tax=Citrobacter enshiensis TaxID=2971264 RepID=UPI0023E81FE6|nr:DUF6311 domain-containing protein [Citrobacter enshiensis]WET42227.1 DUF6311 domain-containing protein [Citrobacter enshiensis]
MRFNFYGLLSIAIGFIFFTLCVGISPLNVTNISFLMNGDAAQHWIGWEFFRHTPLLQWPIGKNYGYGIQLHNSIVYTDSIPIFSVFFKIFSGMVPVEFQYTGLWLLLCFCLQGFFSFTLIKKITGNDIYSLLASIIFVISIPFIDRIGGHFALAAHWLILWALCLYFNREFTFKNWIALLIFSSWVHAYLLAMTLTIWILDITNKVYQKKISTKAIILHIVLSFSLLLLAMYSIGYFTISGSFSSGGFGYYKLNLNSIINPYYGPFSSIINPLPAGKGEYEGLNYIGAGVMLLLVFSIFGVKRTKKNISDELSTHIPLLLLSIALTIYALSNVISWGNDILLEYYIPNFMKSITNTFRASGRFFWIVYYLIFTVSIVGIYKYFKFRTAIIILFSCAVLQIYDVHHVLNVRKNGFEVYHHGYTLNGSNWSYVAKNYEKILTPSPWLFGDDYLKYAYFASVNNMKISFGYFARVNMDVWNKQTLDIGKAISTGDLEEGAVYLFKDKTQYEKVLGRVNQRTYNFEDNGVYVIGLMKSPMSYTKS